MIIRRLILSLALILFAAVTIGVILGLDDAARSQLVGPEPVRPTATIASTTHPDPGTATPSPEPTTPPRQTTRTPKPTASSTPGTSTAPPTTAPPSPTAKPKPKPKPTTAPSTAKPKPGGRIVYLTFDDGPSPYTPQILQILRSTGSTATFFQLGVNTHGQARIEAAIKAQGSNIGNHSYNHPDLTTLSAAQLKWQIAHGPRAKCFRPPYGATNKAVRQAIRRAGAHQVLWDVDTLDWTKPGVKKLERFGASTHVTGGSIILMHDGGGVRDQTVAALPGLIHTLHARGYQIRALPSCS